MQERGRAARGRLALWIALPLIGGLVALVASLPDRPRASARPAATAPAAETSSVAAAPFVPHPLEEGAPRALPSSSPPPRREVARAASPEEVVPAAPLEGVLIDIATGDPLGGWEIGLALARWTAHSSGAELRPIEVLWTASDGSFRTSVALPEGRYDLRPRLPDCRQLERHAQRPGPVLPQPDFIRSLRYRDAAPAAVRIDHLVPPASKGPISIGISVGPRYDVRTALPASRSGCEFEARLVERSDARRLVAEHGQLDPGEPWQVRFERPVAGDVGPGPWVLELASEDGEWAGAAEVESVVGTCARVVAIELRPRARISGRVLGASGAPVAGADVRWLPRDAPAVRDYEERARSDKSGGYALERLPAGEGLLRVETRLAPPLERHLVLAPHARERLDLRVDGLATGALAGTLVAGDGPIAHPPRLALVALEESGLEPPAPRLETSNPAEIHFRFEGVPVGDYELVVTPSDGRAWSPERLRVRVPSEGHEVRRLARESTMLLLDVLDARDRSAVAGAFGLFERGAELVAERPTVPGTVLVDALERYEGAELRVGAPGHRSRVVPTSGLRRSGRFLAGEVLLERGAETLVRVVDAASGAALAGAAVTADGRELARSSRAGLAIVELAAEEAQLGATLAGWELAERGSDGPLALLRMRRAN